ncbi:MAG: nuclear transport factor 2 family protein [Bacteroidota bacterium]
MKKDIITINLNTLKKESWSAQELENAAVVTDFIQNLMNNHDFDYILQTYGDNPYIQHSRGITDGISGLVKYVGGFAKRYPEYTYDVKHIYADGDYISFHSHATLKKKDRGNDKKGFSIIDTWKVIDGQIVEHWDAIQPLDFMMRLVVLLSGGKIANANGVF